jgi:hypothetical protein
VWGVCGAMLKIWCWDLGEGDARFGGESSTKEKILVEHELCFYLMQTPVWHNTVCAS